MIEIIAEIRKKFGSKISRRIRKNNKLPAIVYGKNNKTFGVEVEHDKFINCFRSKNFYIQDIILIVENKKYLVKIKNLDWHAFKTKILHVDFHLKD
ncbi:50S ribosomal protein L25 [Buchnera aphidicola (Tetraneura ulmi)]|uniref:50S ribosomal protein L25 n=1 Tax=Buchnera aphidicola TaxID=9 RepID=UPI003464B26D